MSASGECLWWDWSFGHKVFWSWQSIHYGEEVWDPSFFRGLSFGFRRPFGARVSWFYFVWGGICSLFRGLFEVVSPGSRSTLRIRAWLLPSLEILSRSGSMVVLSLKRLARHTRSVSFPHIHTRGRKEAAEKQK